MTANVLANETSPYLLQHKDNPVHWQAWGAETLALAGRENKPILLSVGYAACHWCHVMAHESFEDSAIAAVMNELFVNVKVDREERPDLDVIYQTALALLGQQGGWPLTMFLTPAGEPFWGGTYFPATARFGRPAFPDVLRRVSEAYHSESDSVRRNADALREALVRVTRPRAGDGLSAETLDQAAAMAIRLVDPVCGGTQGAPKFPQPLFFGLLWRAHLRTGTTAYGAAVRVTLDHMCQGGIYDHLGGGFARYSTDGVWLAPHFEKMLYDNALLIDLLTEVWRESRNPLYAVRVRETVEWTLAEMTVEAEGGGRAFASAFDADSEGEEGKYYVWSADEIDSVLGPDTAAFKEAYDATPQGNWEGRVILNRTASPELGDADHEAFLAGCRGRLLETRSRRIPPLRDDKVLADWNGLMIRALANAGATFAEPSWLGAAESAFAFVRERMSEGGRLGHSWRAGRLRHAAVIDDYANMGAAALALFEATGTQSYVDQAAAWVERANTHYWDDEDGGYFLSADDTADVIARTKSALDNAVPSGNGTMAEVLTRLFFLTGDDAYRARAEGVFRAFSAEGPERLVHAPTCLGAFELLQGAVQIVVVGDAEDPGTRALTEAALDVALAGRILVRLAPGADLPPAHPASGKNQLGGRATAYVCTGTRCGLPVIDPEALRAELSARAANGVGA